MTYAPFDLSGKVCVVTGGNKGIGLGMVEALAASNANVVIWGRKEADNSAAVKKAETSDGLLLLGRSQEGSRFVVVK